jgi:hypothetical protein
MPFSGLKNLGLNFSFLVLNPNLETRDLKPHKSRMFSIFYQLVSQQLLILFFGFVKFSYHEKATKV